MTAAYTSNGTTQSVALHMAFGLSWTSCGRGRPLHRGNIVNQVQQSFDGQDNMTAEYQAHCGAVNTAKTPVVKYGYSDPGTGKSRLTSMTYPDHSVVNYSYNNGLDDPISRLSSISFNGPMAESYTYLGISTVVQRSNPMVTLSYINGSNITGLDSLGRVTDQKWTDTRTSTVTDEFGYVYDADSNRTTETNALYADFNTTYTYDSFNQLSSSTCADGKDSESWSSDPLGNSTTVSGQSRGYNAQNEVTSVGGSNLAYDLNGNVITDEAGRKLTYDAWNSEMGTYFILFGEKAIHQPPEKSAEVGVGGRGPQCVLQAELRRRLLYPAVRTIRAAAADAAADAFQLGLGLRLIHVPGPVSRQRHGARVEERQQRGRQSFRQTGPGPIFSASHKVGAEWVSLNVA